MAQNADVVCQGLCLAWACGTMKDALVYDIFPLVTMSEVCSCHGRKRKRSRSDDSGFLEAASRILAEEDPAKAGVADDSEAITIIVSTFPIMSVILVYESYQH